MCLQEAAKGVLIRNCQRCAYKRLPKVCFIEAAKGVLIRGCLFYDSYFQGAHFIIHMSISCLLHQTVLLFVLLSSSCNHLF